MITPVTAVRFLRFWCHSTQNSKLFQIDFSTKSVLIEEPENEGTVTKSFQMTKFPKIIQIKLLKNSRLKVLPLKSQKSFDKGFEIMHRMYVINLAIDFVSLF